MEGLCYSRCSLRQGLRDGVRVGFLVPCIVEEARARTTACTFAAVCWPCARKAGQPMQHVYLL
jgi:hypothetical protein